VSIEVTALLSCPNECLERGLRRSDTLPGLAICIFSKCGTLEAESMARILVIDDEPDLRTFLELVLKSAGHEVIMAVDGREGMERHRSSPADLVITDLYMPNQDGMETIRELRSCYPEVAVIAMSGSVDTGTMLSVTEKLGAVGILQKPFLTDELIAAVGKALGEPSPA
jgi:DNA-binding NtrC family response regulator